MPLKRVWPYVIVDYKDEMVLVGTTVEEGRESIIAIGSYSRVPNTDMAEVALLIRDDWQNQGLGTTLFHYLTEIAQKHGITVFTAWVMTDNDRMMHIFRRSGYPMRYRIEGDLYNVNLELKKST
jgi:RimJ/RimL family protein N-acetyltransferase